MYVLTVIIAVALSAAVSIALRQIDKNGNSLEKVKRYADKRENDLDGYFKERTDRLSLASSDLETKQVQAVAAVKRLQQQYDEFEKISKGLESKINAVDQIGGKIVAYDKIVHNLMDMEKENQPAV